MVHWTDCERKHIAEVWGKMNPVEIGTQALSRLLVVYPWTRRHFASFGNLTSTAAILGNDNVAKHAKKVMGGLEDAYKNIDNIKKTLSKLSTQHSDTLHVDPDNFRLLAECITIAVAAKFGSAFTPEVQEAWHKFLAVVVSALSKQYH